MIPKKIHYCWFGGAEKPTLIRHCIKSWKKRLPDYEIKEWNESNFDVNMAPFCQEAYSARKYAFVADYCRIYVLATEGGIYMDTDIIILKGFDEFLSYSFASCQEYQPWEFEKVKSEYIDTDGYRKPGTTKPIPGMGIQSGVMMAEKGNPYIIDCLNFYNQMHFPKHLGDIIVCRILSQQMEKYGYRYITEPQHLDHRILVEAPYVFANMTSLNEKSYAWHLYYRSWGKGFSLKQQLRNHFTRIYLFAQLIFHKKFNIKLIAKILF